MSKKATKVQLATPSDLKDKGREEIATYVNSLTADAFVLYVKTKSFHWHLSGSHFRDYHLLFDEQAEQIFAMIDVLAERVRKLGKTTVCSIKHISKLQTLKDTDTPFLNAKEMLNQLLEDNKHFTRQLRAAHEICDKHEDCATTSILEIFIDETERRTWFLFETL